MLVDSNRQFIGSSPVLVIVSGACIVLPGNSFVPPIGMGTNAVLSAPLPLLTFISSFAPVAVPPAALLESDHSAKVCCDDANIATAAVASAIDPQTFLRTM